MKSILAAAVLVLATAGAGSAVTSQSTPGHRQVSAAVAPNDLGWGGGSPVAPTDLGWGGTTAPLSS